MIRDQTRQIFFPFKPILAVSTAYLFVKPGQMHGAMSEELFPLDSAIRRWKEMTVHFFQRISETIYARNVQFIIQVWEKNIYYLWKCYFLKE